VTLCVAGTIHAEPGPAGATVGAAVGATVGTAVGTVVGTAVTTAVGTAVGTVVGTAVGAVVTTAVGTAVGAVVTTAVGTAVGAVVTTAVGTAVGTVVGTAVGAVVTTAVGTAVGAAVTVPTIVTVAPVPDGVPITLPLASLRFFTERPTLAAPAAVALSVILMSERSELPATPDVLKPAVIIWPATVVLFVRLSPDAISAIVPNDMRFDG